MSDNIDTLLTENRTFPPSAEFAKQALLNDAKIYADAAANPEAYWASEAAKLSWFSPWKTICEWKPPHARWFLGGALNASYNCLDRHLEGARRDKRAIIWKASRATSEP